MNRKRIRGIVKNQERVYIPEEHRLLYNEETVDKIFTDRTARDKLSFLQILDGLDEIDMKLITISELKELAEAYFNKEMQELINRLSKSKREY